MDRRRRRGGAETVTLPDCGSGAVPGRPGPAFFAGSSDHSLRNTVLSKPSLASYLPGAIVVAAGIAIALGATSYPLGTLLRPGPGFFPLVIASALSLMGLGVLFDTYRAGRPQAAQEPFAWRAEIFTVASVLVFAFTVERIGYIPASVLLIAIAGLAETRRDWPALALVALFMAIFGTLVFIWGLGLPLKAFGAS